MKKTLLGLFVAALFSGHGRLPIPLLQLLVPQSPFLHLPQSASSASAAAALPQAPQIAATAFVIKIKRRPSVGRQRFECAGGAGFAHQADDGLSHLQSARQRHAQARPNAHRVGKRLESRGSRMFLEPRKPASVSDLIKGLIVQSGNDAPSRWLRPSAAVKRASPI